MNDYKRVKVKNEWVLEHRNIMEQFLGRKLTINEIVHHINGDKHDNRIENLMVVSPSKHNEHHTRITEIVKLKCNNCEKEFDLPLRYFKYKRKKHNQNNFYCSKICCKTTQKKERTVINPTLMELLKEELKKGKSGYKIAKEYNLNKRTVYWNIKKYTLA